MEVIASVNFVAQIGVIWYARRRAAKPAHRRLLLTVAIASLAVCAVAVAVELLFDQQQDGTLVATTEIAAALMWLLYAAIGVAMVGAVVVALRKPGSLRFTWRQRKYQRFARDWSNYRRI